MSVTRTALTGGLAAAALLAAFLWQRDDAATPAMQAAVPRETASAAGAPLEVRGRITTPPARSPAPAEPGGARATEADLRARAREESYALIGGALIDHLVERGLAPADGERVVRRFFADEVRCLFDALRVEADAQSVSYDSVLDGLEAGLYDTDGPLLAAVIDLRGVQDRVMPCALTAAQQAGIESSAFSEATRAALVRRARR